MASMAPIAAAVEQTSSQQSLDACALACKGMLAVTVVSALWDGSSLVHSVKMWREALVRMGAACANDFADDLDLDYHESEQTWTGCVQYDYPDVGKLETTILFEVQRSGFPAFHIDKNCAHVATKSVQRRLTPQLLPI